MTAARPAHLTDAEARTLTRRQILDRVEAEQQYLLGKRRRTEADHAKLNELARIMYAYLPLGKALAAVKATLNGTAGTSFMDTRPCDDDPQENTTPGAHNDKHD